MKQKRKIKSLLPQKQKGKTYLITALLLFLSLILCLWTAALITSSVWAEDSSPVVTQFDYNWLDDNRETLYGIKFIDPSDYEKTISNIFVNNHSLYIDSPVVVGSTSGNIVETWVKSNILWWINNIVNSENITIIGWSGNYISWKNDNATILWWNGNVFLGNTSPQYYRFPLVSVWWKNNSWNAAHGAVFIWWSGNEIKWYGSNLYILWWESNKIETNSSRNNVIIWWKDVRVSYKQDIFAYSNTWNFTPSTSNAFYLNMNKWVWVNTGWIDKWLFVNGAVYLGEVNIRDTAASNRCITSNYWVIGSYSGCLVWCTNASSTNNKTRELLDLWEECKQICRDEPYCHMTENAPVGLLLNHPDYSAQCTNNVNTWHAKICSRDSNFPDGYLNLYKNVIFETVLLDSDTPCPEWQENQCIYKCEEWFHLIWNGETLRCYSDCVLPWDETKKMKHGETKEAYNIAEVSCSNDIYIFPFATEVSENFPGGRMGFAIGGISYNFRAKNRQSPETCENYEHKRSLKCEDGHLKLIDGNGNLLNGSWDEIVKTYKYESCSLSNYSCNTSVYNLTRANVSSIDDNITWNYTDRWYITSKWVTNWRRWKYELCKDYHSQWNNACNSSTGTDNHYRLVECQNHYSTWDTAEDDWRYTCKQDCTLKTTNGGTEYYKHNQTVTWYKSGSVACTNSNDKCESASLTCRDGKRYSQGVETTGYKYNDCKLNKKVCDASYNVSSGEYNQYSGVSNYLPCEWYDANGNSECKSSGTKYKLVGCIPWYHATWLTVNNLTHCTINVAVKDCPNKWTSGSGYWMYPISGSVNDYPWHTELNNKSIEVEKWQYITRWTWSWNNGYWTWMYKSNTCDWSCRDKWHKSSDWKSCEKNRCINGPIESDYVIKSSNTRPSGDWNKSWRYVTGAYLTNTLTWACEWWCKDGSHKVWNTCVLNECRYCANNNSTNIWFPYCFPIDFGDDCKENEYYNELYNNN